MKIAFLYGTFSLGNPPPPERLFDFTNLWDSPRGLTGSEHSCISYAVRMAERGHNVSIYTPQPSLAPQTFQGVKVLDLETYWRGFEPDAHDVFYSWNEPDLLRRVPAGAFRVCNQQLNDFRYCLPGWEEHVDLLTSPSAHHLEFLRTQAPGLRVTAVIPNGCTPSIYGSVPKVPGRVAYISSPDRGLHLVLQEWMKIRRAVPAAHLRIYYHNLLSWAVNGAGWTPDTVPGNRDLLELGQRARYIMKMIPLLKDHGVEAFGGVSRRQMTRQLSEAQVLAYPCDTVRYTEGFSVSTLEGCASGAVPVIVGTDALGSIYGGQIPVIPPPAREHIGEWTERVIGILQDGRKRDSCARQAREFAEQFDYQKLTGDLEALIYQHRPALRPPKVESVEFSSVEPDFFTRAGTAGYDAYGGKKPVTPKPPLRGPTRIEQREFRGHPYKLACTDYGAVIAAKGTPLPPGVPFQHPSWFSFDDEKEVRERHWLIGKDDVVLDIGAAYGSYAVTALACGAAYVFAWSPEGPAGEEPERVFLAHTAAANGWDGRLAVYGSGLYAVDGFLSPSDQAFFSQDFHQDTYETHELIRVETLDWWADDNNKLLQDLRLRSRRWWAKLDVEGAEVEVLRGGILFLERYRPRLLIECHNFKRPTLQAEVRELLEALNYRHVFSAPHHAVVHSYFVHESDPGSKADLHFQDD